MLNRWSTCCLTGFTFQFLGCEASLRAMMSRTGSGAAQAAMPTDKRSLELVVHSLLMPHIRSLGQVSCR